MLLGTAPLVPATWRVILPFADLLLGLEEGRKWLVRRRAQQLQWPRELARAPRVAPN